jgi:hemerythrin
MDKKMFLEWDPQYSTGIPGIDSHHRELILRCNGLANSLFGNEMEAFRKNIHELVQYIAYHLSTEENLLEMAGFSRLTELKHQHRTLIRELYREAAVFEHHREESDPAFLPADEFIHFLQGVIFNHLTNHGREYLNSIQNFIARRTQHPITAPVPQAAG